MSGLNRNGLPWLEAGRILKVRDGGGRDGGSGGINSKSLPVDTQLDFRWIFRPTGERDQCPAVCLINRG
jgi:hypothetical protein